MIELAEIRALSLQEKLQMMEMLWDDISPQQSELDIPQWHREILEDREQLVREGKAAFIDWEIAKRQIRDSVS